MCRFKWYYILNIVFLLLLLIATGACDALNRHEVQTPDGAVGDLPTPPTQPDGLPVIHFFNADPGTILIGGSSELSWNVSNADTITIMATSLKTTVSSYGSISVSPYNTTTYKLTATNSVGAQSEYVTVIVAQSKPPKPIPVPENLPVIYYFSADPGNIVVGGSSELGWEVSNADTIMITAPSWEKTLSSYGSISVSPATTTTYKLTATNSVGSQSEYITVTVEVSDKPDLVITELWRSGPTLWYYAIANQGRVGCNGSSSKLVIYHKTIALQDIGPLASGELRVEFFKHSYVCDPGEYRKWSVIADANNDIDESNEDNNSRQEDFICSDKYY